MVIYLKPKRFLILSIGSLFPPSLLFLFVFTLSDICLVFFYQVKQAYFSRLGDLEIYSKKKSIKSEPVARFELATFCLQGRCTNHCAIQALLVNYKN